MLNAAGDLNLGTGLSLYDSVLNVTGNITSSGYVYPSAGSSIGGGITAISALIPTGVTVGGAITLLDNAAGLSFTTAGGTIANNITTGTFNNNIFLNQIAFGYCETPPVGGGGASRAATYLAVSCATYADATYNLTGTLTLNADLLIDVAKNSTVNINGTVNYNGHTITLTQDSLGALNIGSTTAVVPTLTTTLSDSQPTTPYTVQNKETAILDGTRQVVQVNTGGILLGNGTALRIIVLNGGIIAPGHSPGKLTSTTSLFLGPGSTYQAQLQTSAAGGYDQIQVSDPSSTTGNDVIIDPAAILDVQLYTDYKINQGDTFTIIDNLQPSTQTVTGTFSGLAEGAQLTVGGITFSISYVGGDGNDVVLTALNTGSDPGTPNTGAQMLKLANPALLIGLGIATAAVLFTLARRRLNR